MGIEERSDGSAPEGITRKELLHGAAAGGVLIAAGGILAACGGGDSTTTTGTAAAAASGDPKMGGLLRVGIPQGSAADSLDPHQLFVYPDWARAFNLYNLLAYPNPETFELELQLAEEIEANDDKGDVWTVRLKDGVEFHDGKTLDADDLIFSVRRMIEGGGPATSTLYFIDPNGMKKVDKRTVEFTFKTPYAEFPQAMAASNEFIVPVGFDPKKPVGTGPFKFKSMQAGDLTTMVRFENYFGEGPYIDELRLVNLNDESARVNALLAGQIEAMQSLPLQQLSTIEGNSELAVLNAETGNWSPFTMRMDVEPFNDPKVRQAFRLIANREQLVQQSLQGQGRVANDIYSPYDPAYASQLPQREQDIEQAKSLLAEAGKSDLTLDLITGPINVGVVEAAQIFAEQAKEAGVTLNLRTKDAGSFFTDGWPDYTFASDTNPTYPSYLTTTALQDGPNAPFNATHMNIPEFLQLYKQASRTMDDEKRKQLQQDMQQIQYDEGGYMIWGFYNQIDAMKSSVKGLVPDKSGWPLTSYAFHRAWIDE